jgi:rhodanese-related sulfurtransferase
MKRILIFAAFSLLAGAQDPWPDKEIVQPKTLADRLQAKEPVPVFYVGFPTLYRNGAHVSGAILAGPCSKAEGLEALKKAVADLPRDKELFIYCGCCPFVKCPNIRPAYSALHEIGFTNVRVVMIETNLHTDWIEKGYPSEKSSQ